MTKTDHDHDARDVNKREYQDALPEGAARGRGAGLNPGNRFEDIRLHVLGEHLDEIARQRRECAGACGSSPSPESLGEDACEISVAANIDGVQVQTRVYPDQSRSIINHVDSPDLPFSWTVNPYRGCEHGCIYCYARPGHEYLGLSCGLDFETKIMAKFDAPQLLRAEFMKPKWGGEAIVLSGVTDPYQPVERELNITRRILEVCEQFGQPVGMITKNALITRDVDILARLARLGAANAAISLTTLDHALASKMEPRASSPKQRLEAIRTLASAGIPVTVMAAPIIPGLNDTEIPAILAAAAEAGATSAGWVLLKLPYQIKALFLEWLRRHVPLRAAHIESLLRSTRDGALYDSRHFVRQRGEGPAAEQIGQIFRVFAARHGLNKERELPRCAPSFRRPEPHARPNSQLDLWRS